MPRIFFSFGHNLFYLLCNTNCTMLGLCLPCCPCDVKPCPAENCHLTGMLSLQKLTACVTIILTLLSQRADNRKSTKKKKRRETNSSICVFVKSWFVESTPSFFLVCPLFLWVVSVLAVWFEILLDVLSFLDDNEDLLTIRFIILCRVARQRWCLASSSGS